MGRGTRQGSVMFAALVGIAVLWSISGCQSGSSGIGVGESISSYQGTLVGDNSAVGAIIDRLEWENSITEFSLSTAEPPYGITIQQGSVCASGICNFVDANAESNRENSATLLALIDNADWVQIYSPIHPCPHPSYVAGENSEPQCHFDYRFERADLADQIAAIQSSWNNS